MKTFENWVKACGDFSLEKQVVLKQTDTDALSSMTLGDIILHFTNLANIHGSDAKYSEGSEDDCYPCVYKEDLESDLEYNARIAELKGNYDAYVKREHKQRESDRIKDEINALTIKLRELQSK